MYIVWYLLLPLSHCPMPHFLYVCPLVAPDLVRLSQGIPPPLLPPPRRQTLKVDGEGEWGVGVCGDGGGSHHSNTRFCGKEKIRVSFFFKNRACDVDFCRPRRLGIDFYAVNVKKHRAIYSYLTENRR